MSHIVIRFLVPSQTSDLILLAVHPFCCHLLQAGCKRGGCEPRERLGRDKSSGQSVPSLRRLHVKDARLYSDRLLLSLPAAPCASSSSACSAPFRSFVRPFAPLAAVVLKP
ncbi:hypothetical protein MPTK2_5g24420 [Marchantia polymorpha subsp. ruderalis]